MADPQAARPVSDFRPDDDEPEEEDPRRSSLASGESSALIVKPPPLQLAVAPETDMQHPANAELVYPWMSSEPGAVTVLTESSMITPTTLYATAVRSEPGPRCEGVTTALLASSPHTMKNDSNCSAEKPLEYGTNVSMQRRHSILRMSASKTASGQGLRKSASVEFVLDHAHQQAAQSLHASTSSIGREPRYVAVLYGSVDEALTLVLAFDSVLSCCVDCAAA
ncbi:unnamed protein product [Phytophthora fragariaefolia]|uniref:Unnamed protein product n=1 Tax=Phytophthora fragariaefolia TaxID=1490495 RepID=A0A9W7CVL8_9STRA|nr:unnamed protein product [Phytophthora fragariaefolia]